MADDASAYVIPLHQVRPKRKAKSGAERAKARRPRKRQEQEAAVPKDAEALASASVIPREFLAEDLAFAEPPVAPPAVTLHPSGSAAPTPQHVTPALLSLAAFALAAVGITINGWFARSLGSSDVAAWLFLALGVAADLVALAMPSRAVVLWRHRQRATALVGWAVWLMTFIFAVTAGIGFASTNISDVTQARASRVTPAVTNAQAALTDAMTARDRECKGGVGKFCREREATVAERRQILDTTMTAVEQTADPQTDAAIKLVAWLSRDTLRPVPADFAMLRLVLLALLPQIGGILLMVARRA
jgi:hypothetical protein